MIIPFSPPDITQREIDCVNEVLSSGWITTGPKTKLFEKKIAEYIGTSQAVCLNSATACMELTLRLLGIGKGDEVIVPAYTYTATASVVDHVGAKIVMIDTANDSFEMDYDKLVGAITPNTKAIIAVDLGGKIADFDRVFQAVEQKRDIFSPANPIQKLFGRIVVIADAAHSFGAEKDGKKSGQIADFTSFSFHAVKNLTTAEGGAVTWRDVDGLDNDEVYRQYMLASLHGQSKDALAKTKIGAWEYDIVYPAYKCNMTDIHAAVGLAQLERYDGILKRRREIIEKYDVAFKPLGAMTLEHYTENSSSSGHLYLMRVPGITYEQRGECINKLAEAGISANVHYKPLPMMTAYKSLGFDIADYPNAYAQFVNEITLPLHTCLTDEQVDYVIEKVKEILR